MTGLQQVARQHQAGRGGRQKAGVEDELSRRVVIHGEEHQGLTGRRIHRIGTKAQGQRCPGLRALQRRVAGAGEVGAGQRVLVGAKAEAGLRQRARRLQGVAVAALRKSSVHRGLAGVGVALVAVGVAGLRRQRSGRRRTRKAHSAAAVGHAAEREHHCREESAVVAEVVAVAGLHETHVAKHIDEIHIAGMRCAAADD